MRRGCIPHGSQSTPVDTVGGPCACLVLGQPVHVPVAIVARVAADDTAVAVGDTVAATAAHTAVAVGGDGGCWRCQTRLTFASELWKRLMELRNENRIESVKKGLLHCY